MMQEFSMIQDLPNFDIFICKMEGKLSFMYENKRCDLISAKRSRYKGNVMLRLS